MKRNSTFIICVAVSALYLFGAVIECVNGQTVMAIIFVACAMGTAFMECVTCPSEGTEQLSLDWEESAVDAEEIEALNRQDGLENVNGYTLIGWG